MHLGTVDKIKINVKEKNEKKNHHRKWLYYVNTFFSAVVFVQVLINVHYSKYKDNLAYAKHEGVLVIPWEFPCWNFDSSIDRQFFSCNFFKTNFLNQLKADEISSIVFNHNSK